MVNTLKINLSRMANVNFADLLVGMKKRNMVETIVSYIIDSRTRRSVYLKSWFLDHWNEITVHEICPQFVGRIPDDSLALDVKNFVQRNIVYKGDPSVWHTEEYWQTPLETWTLKTGDCEDGAILIAAILLQLGFDPNQIFIVAGNVVGGAHCYIDYISSVDGCDYNLDWCYWPQDSLKKMYGLNDNYFRGTKEWFRFNTLGTYIEN